MKAVYIYPEDLRTHEYSDQWIAFIKKFGYVDGEQIWNCILVAPIDITSFK